MNNCRLCAHLKYQKRERKKRVLYFIPSYRSSTILNFLKSDQSYFTFFRDLFLWDADQLVQVQHVSIDPSCVALDVDLCGTNPLIITNDNLFHFISSNQKNIPILDAGKHFLEFESLNNYSFTNRSSLKIGIDLDK